MEKLKYELRKESKDILICLLLELCCKDSRTKEHILDLLLKYK